MRAIKQRATRVEPCFHLDYRVSIWSNRCVVRTTHRTCSCFSRGSNYTTPSNENERASRTKIYRVLLAIGFRAKKYGIRSGGATTVGGILEREREQRSNKSHASIQLAALSPMNRYSDRNRPGRNYTTLYTDRHGFPFLSVLMLIDISGYAIIRPPLSRENRAAFFVYLILHLFSFHPSWDPRLEIRAFLRSSKFSWQNLEKIL